jgi:rSAM/selenodomain-associated transferase 2
VIVPALNEVALVGASVASARAPRVAEVIVVDGGSTDGTPLAAQASGARVVTCSPGRARQMNEGARVATGDVLLFLHADTRLPDGFAEGILEILDRPGTAAGAFRLGIDGPGWSLRVMEMGANLRSRFLERPWGDQALFLRADLFRDLGGFPDVPFLEDVIFLGRLRRRGRVALAPEAVSTSAGRWRRLGPWRVFATNQLILLGYLLGVSPATLARHYRR